MKIILIGANGLVGSAFARYFETHNLSFYSVTRKDMHTVVGTECDLIINCNGNANKSKANAEPEWDFEASVSSVVHYVHAIKAKKTVHISTVDVYGDTSSTSQTKEDSNINTEALMPYGYHKYMAEEYVRRFCPNHLIIRLAGLVGPGLTKNPIFDHVTDGKKIFISGRSILNFMHTDDIVVNIMELVNNNVIGETINIASSNSIELKKLPSISSRPLDFHKNAETVIQKYEINVDKARRYCSLLTSEESIQKYCKNLKRN